VINIPLDKILPVTYARDNLANLIQNTTGETVYVLTKGGRPRVALIDIVYLEKLCGEKLGTGNFSGYTEPPVVASNKNSISEEKPFKAIETVLPQKSSEPTVKPISASTPVSTFSPPATPNLSSSSSFSTPSAAPVINNDTNSTIPEVKTEDPKKVENSSEEKSPTDNKSVASDDVPFVNFSASGTPTDEKKESQEPKLPSADEIVSKTFPNTATTPNTTPAPSIPSADATKPAAPISSNYSSQSTSGSVFASKTPPANPETSTPTPTPTSGISSVFATNTNNQPKKAEGTTIPINSSKPNQVPAPSSNLPSNDNTAQKQILGQNNTTSVADMDIG